MIDKIKKITVKYNNKIVGYLVEYENNKVGFQYDNDWIKNGFSISPFSLPLNNNIFFSNKDFLYDLFGVFFDSLPDGWGALLQRRMLKNHGINQDLLTPIQRLYLVQSNGLGALLYEPTFSKEDKMDQCDLDNILLESKKILSDENENIDLDKLFQLGGSSGGARPKIHIKINNDYWIVKFPCLVDPINIGEKEYRANMLAKKCGINVNEFKLLKSNICSGYFAAKRFDRNTDKRIHMISLSSLLETTHRIPNLDYAHLFQVIERISVVNDDKYEAFRRMCFNVFYENKDDHGKNFAFLYDESLKGYKLSPAYDLTCTKEKAEHEMSVLGKGNPTEEDLLLIASKFKLSLSKCKDIIEHIKTVLKMEN